MLRNNAVVLTIVGLSRGMARAPIRRGDRPSPELSEARAILTRAHREGIRELRDTLTGEQMREFRLLMRVSVAPQAFRR